MWLIYLTGENVFRGISIQGVFSNVYDFPKIKAKIEKEYNITFDPIPTYESIHYEEYRCEDELKDITLHIMHVTDLGNQ